MCKKFIVLGVLAVAVGGLFVFKTQEGSLVRVWWNKLAKKVDKKITPEDRVEQIKLEIKKIDQAIDDEIDQLADLRRQYRAEDKVARGQRDRLAEIKDRMKVLLEAMDKGKSQVSVGDEVVQEDDYAAKL